MESGRPLWSRIARPVVLALSLGLAGCTSLPQSTFDVAGPVAERQLHLFNFTAMLAVVIGTLVALVALYVVVRFRDRGGPGRAPQVRGHRGLQMLWTVIPVLIVAYKAVPTVQDAFFLAQTPPGAMQVTVVGHQWWWEFQYPELGITTANELYMPVDRPVEFTVTSADVIHSFWVPRLGGKIDAIPGRNNVFWLQADEAGTFWGQCAELCGASHAQMRLRVHALPEQEFEAWARHMQELAEKPVTPGDAVAARGEQLFLEGKACFSCHTIDGTKAQGKVGPNLTAIGARTTIAAGVLENTDAEMARWLADPQAIKPKALMPNLKLTDEEIQALVAYLRSQR